ncbi:MAG: hypothetical protein LUD17_11115 [Bacteroidales bacterium]|nr:hypothetical protein [Bacteroidales bacterium]
MSRKLYYYLYKENSGPIWHYYIPAEVDFPVCEECCQYIEKRKSASTWIPIGVAMLVLFLSVFCKATLAFAVVLTLIVWLVSWLVVSQFMWPQKSLSTKEALNPLMSRMLNDGWERKIKESKAECPSPSKMMDKFRVYTFNDKYWIYGPDGRALDFTRDPNIVISSYMESYMESDGD